MTTSPTSAESYGSYQSSPQKKICCYHGRVFLYLLVTSRQAGGIYCCVGLALIVATAILSPLCFTHVIPVNTLTASLITGIGGGFGVFFMGGSCIVFHRYFQTPDGQRELKKK